MVTFDDGRKKIEEIRNSAFQVSDYNFGGNNIKCSELLEIAQRCILSIYDIEDASSKEKTALIEELDEVMKDKFKELNPDFDERVLSDMVLQAYHSSSDKYPMDIFVVDDAIFQVERIVGVSGEWEIKTFISEGLNTYYSAYGDLFAYKIDSNNTIPEEDLTKDEDRDTSKFISDQINSIYGKNITKPIYESNKAGIHRGYSGLTNGDVDGVNVYINRTHDNIGRSIKAKQEGEIKFCIQDKDNIAFYIVRQSFVGDKPKWTVMPMLGKQDVWRLTEAISKNNNNPKVMTRKMQ